MLPKFGSSCLLSILASTAFFFTVFAFAHIMVMFVQWSSEGKVENPLMISTIYGPGIVIALMARPLVVELATGKLFGQVPTRWETESMRWLGPLLIHSPHAVFITWAAMVMGKTKSFPDPIWLGGSLLAFVGFSVVRSRLKLREPVKNGTFPLAIDIQSHEKGYQTALEEIRKARPLEAIKHLRTSYNLNLVQAVHTMRKIRFDQQPAPPPSEDEGDQASS